MILDDNFEAKEMNVVELPHYEIKVHNDYCNTEGQYKLYVRSYGNK